MKHANFARNMQFNKILKLMQIFQGLVV